MTETAFFRHIWVAAALILAMFLVAMEAPAWINFFCGTILLVRFLVDFQIIGRIPKWTANTIAVVLFVEVILQYHTVLQQEPAAVLLLGLSALKILDFQSDRDLKFLFLLGVLLVSLKPLFSIDLTWILPSFVAFSYYGLACWTQPKRKS